jgi:DNA modification methylase
MTPFYTDPLVTLLHGDCIEVMAGLEADSVDAVVTDPPYGLEFMGKSWDSFATEKRKPELTPTGEGHSTSAGPFLAHAVNKYVAGAPFQAWCEQWGREALRVTKPGGYLLAFGGTRTHHRLVCALEDAGWIIRDELDWIYASGFPKGKANLKPAHEPIVLARKPGPLRPLGIDECRIGTDGGTAWVSEGDKGDDGQFGGGIKDGGIFFIIPKADRAERERGLTGVDGKRGNTHPTVKSLDLMRHLVRLVTPNGGTVLDPFLGSGTTCLAASEEGFKSIGIERELEYLDIAKGRLMATPMGLGLDVPAPETRGIVLCLVFLLGLV